VSPRFWPRKDRAEPSASASAHTPVAQGAAEDRVDGPASSTTLKGNDGDHPQHRRGASCITRATEGGPGELALVAGATGDGPAGAPDGVVGDPTAASSDDAVPQRADPAARPTDAATAAEHRAHDDLAVGRATGEWPEGRVPPAVFLQDGYAALDIPPFPADDPGSEPMPPRKLRPRGKEPRHHVSIRLMPTEARLIEEAVKDRNAPSFSGFIAEAAVAVATNQLTAVLPHERAVRAIGEEMGRTMWHLSKIGSNINQIARHLNMGDTAAAARVERSLDLLDALLAEMRAVNIRLADAVPGA
jgi:uncharacterized protein (DUF1778 family)